MATSRRRPGEIRDAIVAVLGKNARPSHISDIHAGVQRQLGGDVPASSVRSYLQLGTDGSVNLFERVGRGTYKLKRRRSSA